jgi:hypothetical protein
LPPWEERKFLESLAGNPVTITGRIELYKGCPEIVIFIPSADCQRVSKIVKARWKKKRAIRRQPDYHHFGPLALSQTLE